VGRVVALLSVLLLACGLASREPAASPPAPTSHHRSPLPAAILVDADVAFVPAEREMILDAAARLYRQTNGNLIVAVRFGLDWRTDENVPRPGESSLVRVSHDMPVVRDWESGHPANGYLMGLTLPEGTNSTILLVADRIESEGIRFGGVAPTFVSTVMHELLHAFGLSHVNDHVSVMGQGYENWTVAATCLHKADVEEICRVYDCNAIVPLHYCPD
jgi:Matrixin